MWTDERGGIPGLAILGEYEPGPPPTIILYEPDILDRAHARGEPVELVAAQALAHEFYHHLAALGIAVPMPGISEEAAARVLAGALGEQLACSRKRLPSPSGRSGDPAEGWVR